VFIQTLGAECARNKEKGKKERDLAVNYFTPEKKRKQNQTGSIHKVNS